MGPLIVRHLGLQHYQPVWQAMSHFTDQRDDATQDELWLVEHYPVFTQGQAGKPEHLLNPGDIPVVQSDRGGQVTYHGPGQLVIYPLINLRRRHMGVRDMVTLLESLCVEFLAEFDIESYPKADAPGVYVAVDQSKSPDKPLSKEAKIASVGLRVRRACCFHGLSINIHMDLSPFRLINPCGFTDMPMTQVSDLTPYEGGITETVLQSIGAKIANKLNAAPVVYNDQLPLALLS
ncbi:MAG: lipoyl(octanoyl) transferase LipB [Pseudomonadota bacterium]